jgi:hypothetical protein
MDGRLMSRYRQLVIATKRAKNHGLDFCGPFTPIGKTGPLIAARNYCLLLDAYPDSDYLGYLVVLNMWAEAINRYCDGHLINGDDEISCALGSFMSRQFVDTTLIVH